MTVKIEIYIDDNNYFTYDVISQRKAREHCFRIQQQGYNDMSDGKMVYYPAHRLHKVQFSPCDTSNDVIAKKYECND